MSGELFCGVLWYEGIGGVTKLVALIMADDATNGEYFVASRSRVAKKAGISIEEVEAAFAELLVQGLIWKVKEFEGEAVYRFNLAALPINRPEDPDDQKETERQHRLWGWNQ